MSDAFFDATEVEPSSGFEPIPAGEYVAVATDTERKPTKSGNGEYLQIEFEILEGEYKGRKLWDRFNLWNSSTQAVQIARQNLSALCHSINVLKPKDPVDLQNIPVVIVVKMRRNQDNELSNEIKGYKPKQSYAPGAASAAPAAQNNKAPWAK